MSGRMRFIFLTTLYLTTVAVLIAGSLLAQAPARGPVASYTAPQAAQGKTAYDQNCASCHGANSGRRAVRTSVEGAGISAAVGRPAGI